MLYARPGTRSQRSNTRGPRRAPCTCVPRAAQVLTLFFFNKATQLGTFLLFYFNVLGWSNPFEAGVLARLALITPLQWIWLV